MGKDCSKESWISFILRMAMASLFAVAAFDKFHGGLNGVVTSFTEMFKDSFLPLPLVALYARLIPFVETVIALWLILGIRLKAAWIFTAFTLISLAFGMVVARQGQTAAENYVYVLMACAGLYFSEFDTCHLGCGCGKKG